jgi:hypothetical protein
MHPSAKYPGGTEDETSLARMDTKPNGEENTVVTRLKPDTTAYRCRRKKIMLQITKPNTKGYLIISVIQSDQKSLCT